jgi:hypothetical protein
MYKKKNSNYTKISISKLKKQIQTDASKSYWIKSNYIGTEIKTYLDVPGWINDAVIIFKEFVDNAEDGDIFVEIGTYFGQSACYMGELIKNSGKRIKFDTFDTFEVLDSSMRAGYHPTQFIEYRFSERYNTSSISDIVKSHFNMCGVSDYINMIICDAKYAPIFYEDLSIKLLYIDALNEKKPLLDFLKSMWVKIKPGGSICGDDIVFRDVESAINDFLKTLNPVEYSIEYPHISYKITKNDI